MAVETQYYPVWWNTGRAKTVDGDNMARVLEMRPYKGAYKQWFSHVLKLEAPNTANGWLEMAVSQQSVDSRMMTVLS